MAILVLLVLSAGYHLSTLLWMATEVFVNFVAFKLHLFNLNSAWGGGWFL